MYVPRIVITSGEPAGIGPDTCVVLAQARWAADLVVAGDASVLAGAAAALNLPLDIEPYHPSSPVSAHQAAKLRVLHIPVGRPVVAGRLDSGNARYVLQMLDRACDGCMNGEFAAMVTAPVQKSIIMDAGYQFSGHTEYLAKRTRSALPVMMLVAANLRVALATTHLPLRAVSDALNVPGLLHVLRILSQDLQHYWGLARARIAVCGLNPHAGEGGHLGDEEQRIIGPAIAQARAMGLDVDGPIPADTLFVPSHLAPYDVVLTMYHDQGLPVLKHAGFGQAVNVTLGLPIVRTSVDHGTALDLAGSGRADAGSLIAAIDLAADMAAHRP